MLLGKYFKNRLPGLEQSLQLNRALRPRGIEEWNFSPLLVLLEAEYSLTQVLSSDNKLAQAITEGRTGWNKSEKQGQPFLSHC